MCGGPGGMKGLTEQWGDWLTAAESARHDLQFTYFCVHVVPELRQVGFVVPGQRPKDRNAPVQEALCASLGPLRVATSGARNKATTYVAFSNVVNMLLLPILEYINMIGPDSAPPE